MIRRITNAFTLVELLIVMAIISILMAMSMSAMQGALEEGRKRRCEAVITKIDQLIMEKYNSYKMRTVPIKLPAGSNARFAARLRLHALRDLMRMEMPDRMTDITDGPAVLMSASGTPLTWNRPTLSSTYSRAVGSSPNLTNENAESLYLILAGIKEGESNATSFFLTSEIGDTDSDGLREILDPWGTPIRWLRAAPGHSRGIPDWNDASFKQPSNKIGAIENYIPLTTQVIDSQNMPDPFDPLKVDWRYEVAAPAAYMGKVPFGMALRPLIYSAGPDRDTDIVNIYTDNNGANATHVRNAVMLWPNNAAIPSDPFYCIETNGKLLPWMGACYDTDDDNRIEYLDNVTNHALAVPGN